MADEDKSVLEGIAEAEGDAIDRSSLPEGLNEPREEPRPEPAPERQADPLDDLRREIEELRSQVRQPEPVQPEPPQDDIDELMWSNPSEYRKRLTEDIKTELRSEYTQAQNWRDFWSDFDRENPSLASHHHIVEAVMRQHWNDIEKLGGKTGRDKVAELTKADLLSLVPQKPKKADDSNTLEGAGADVLPMPTRSEPDGSLSAALRARAQKRTV